MFNMNLNFAACSDDENILLAELIHDRNKLLKSGGQSPELDALIDVLKGQSLSENAERRKRTVKKSAGHLRGFFSRIKLRIPEGRAHSKLV